MSANEISGTGTGSPVAVLSDEECWSVLRTQVLGRLAVAAGGEIDIFPVNFVVDDSTILLRTAPGTKLVEMTIHNTVAFEVDAVSESDAVSVVVKGTARWLDTQTEIAAAQQAPLASWIPTLRYTFVRITPTSVSGRRFRPGPAPEED